MEKRTDSPLKQTITTDVMPDRRLSPRVKLQAQGRLWLSGKQTKSSGIQSRSEIPCTLRDVSCGGAQISLAKADLSVPLSIQVGDFVTLGFSIGSSYELEATVIWLSQERARQFTMGITWMTLKQEIFDRLALEIARIAVNRRRNLRR